MGKNKILPKQNIKQPQFADKEKTRTEATLCNLITESWTTASYNFYHIKISQPTCSFLSFPLSYVLCLAETKYILAGSNWGTIFLSSGRANKIQTCLSFWVDHFS